ncbi:MAG: nucleotide exchange factor GrpE [Nanoarchaeota archaeon]|nr:nucleotide exchange factor GrpE [Nanoarchaeota archaeon]MBU1004816.1 nucleotide exchange factor GrpE [Nanoarchaeota archaeon]MBU1946611.1 nucleotide exchange factor GrpE [Nanoarchaeota archaeon]
MKSEETKEAKGIDKLKQKLKDMKKDSEEKGEQLKECKSEIKSETKKEDEKEKKIEELTDTLQRLQAEFENYKKYVDKSKSEFQKYARADMIMKLLPTLDSFEMALKNTENKEKFIKGIDLIFSQLFQLLENEGLRPIECIGKTTDPYKHEVLLMQESDKEEGLILEELQKGYMLGDKVLRHSKVKAAKKRKTDADNKADKAK